MTHIGKEPDFSQSLTFDWDVITTEKYFLIMTRQQLLESTKVPEKLKQKLEDDIELMRLSKKRKLDKTDIVKLLEYIV